MARTKSESNGRLEEAMALLFHNQASFVAQLAETNRQIAESERRMAETNRINSERFARIETMLIEHNRILADHSRTLQSLTDAIREKIGFKAPQQPS